MANTNNCYYRQNAGMTIIMSIFTCEETGQQGGQQRSLVFRMDVREHAEQETVTRHGVQNPGQREHGSY